MRRLRTKSENHIKRFSSLNHFSCWTKRQFRQFFLFLKKDNLFSWIFLEKKQSDSVQHNIKNVLAMNSSNASAYIILSDIYFAKGNFEKCLKAFQMSISFDKKNNCECGGKYSRKHKSLHFKTKKHQNYLIAL